MAEILSVSGYVMECGDMGAVQNGIKGRGVVIDTGPLDVTILGLTKDDCKALAKHMRQQVTVQITAVGKPAEGAK